MSTLISTDGIVSIAGVKVGVEGVPVTVGSMEGVKVVIDDVDVRGKPVKVAVTGGMRIIGVAV
jgi:hypothetical protein